MNSFHEYETELGTSTGMILPRSRTMPRHDHNDTIHLPWGSCS